METIEMTDTERLVKINSLKAKHDTLKRELLEHIDAIEEKQKEMHLVEEEYVRLMEKLIK